MASKADGPNPGSMYKLKPYYDPKERVPVSDVVYKLQPIYDNISEVCKKGQRNREIIMYHEAHC